MFPPFKGGGGRKQCYPVLKPVRRGAKSFGPVIFLFVAPGPVINDRTLSVVSFCIL